MCYQIHTGINVKSGNHLHTIEAVRKTTALKNEFQPDLYETIIHKIFAQNISSCLLLLRFVIIIFHLGIYVHRVPSLDVSDFRRFSIIVHLFIRRVCVVYMCNWSVFVHLGSTVRAIECYCVRIECAASRINKLFGFTLSLVCSQNTTKNTILASGNLLLVYVRSTFHVTLNVRLLDSNFRIA